MDWFFHLALFTPTGGEGEDDEADLLERHYYSTSTALGVTVGVGCLLLVLNALIFSAIYYQRRRRKAREENVVSILP